MVIPDHYLQANPTARVAGVTADISDHGTSCKLFRLSPFEGWRVERTNRRAGGPDAARFRSTELVPGGFSSSTCSPIVYTDTLFGAEYNNNVFVCDPGNNLIHRDVLEPAGSCFVARRGSDEREFLASTDNWFRPVDLELGPDGAVYVLDFYREVIETPLSLPEDIKSELNLESRERGRVWRIAPTEFDPGPLPDLAKLSTDKLILRLASRNKPTRLMIQRMLIERSDPKAVPALQRLAKQSSGRPWLPNLLYLLDRFDALTAEQLVAALRDELAGNRIVGLKLSEQGAGSNPILQAAMTALASDPSSLVRFQLALSSAKLPADERGAVLAKLLLASDGDRWLQSAVLLSIGDSGNHLLRTIRDDSADAKSLGGMRPFVVDLSSRLVREGTDADRNEVIRLATEGSPPGSSFSLAVLEGAGQGMRGRRPTLAAWTRQPPARMRPVADRLTKRFQDIADQLDQPTTPLNDRITAARILAFAPSDLAIGPLSGVIDPTSPPALQLQAIRGLGSLEMADVGSRLLAAWPRVGPSVRRELIEQLLTDSDRVSVFLDAIEQGRIRPSELDPARVIQLKSHKSEPIRQRAEQLFAKAISPDRTKVLAKYAVIDDLTGEAGRGQLVFRKNCATCHRVGGEGHEVGPNLLATVPGKSSADLLVALIDPNREVDPKFVNYLMNTLDGKVVTGIVVADTPAVVTLRRADGAEEVVPREDIDTLKSTGLSLMPEGLEKNASPQEVADLLAYLRGEVQKAAGQKPPG